MRRFTVYNSDISSYELVNENTSIESLINALGKYEEEVSALTLGEALTRARQSKKLTQKELALELGFSQVAISQYENNHRVPSPNIFNTLALFLLSDHLENLNKE